jgi:hypothetical protein
MKVRVAIGDKTNVKKLEFVPESISEGFDLGLMMNQERKIPYAWSQIRNGTNLLVVGIEVPHLLNMLR